MINVYVFGSNKFVKESIKDFNTKEYNISTTDNPELFRIQLAKEDDPKSIILVDKNKLTNNSFLSKINPFKNKNTLDIDFIKNHPLLNQDISSVEVEEYKDVKQAISNSMEEPREEISETEEEFEDAEPQTEEIEEVKEEPESEFDLEELLANGVETIEDSETEKDEEDFDLEELLANGVPEEEDQVLDLENEEPDEGQQKEEQQEEKEETSEALLELEEEQEAEEVLLELEEEQEAEEVLLELEEEQEEGNPTERQGEDTEKTARRDQIVELLEQLLEGHNVNIQISTGKDQDLTPVNFTDPFFEQNASINEKKAFETENRIKELENKVSALLKSYEELQSEGIKENPEGEETLSPEVQTEVEKPEVLSIDDLEEPEEEVPTEDEKTETTEIKELEEGGHEEYEAEGFEDAAITEPKDEEKTVEEADNEIPPAEQGVEEEFDLEELLANGVLDKEKDGIEKDAPKEELETENILKATLGELELSSPAEENETPLQKQPQKDADEEKIAEIKRELESLENPKDEVEETVFEELPALEEKTEGEVEEEFDIEALIVNETQSSETVEDTQGEEGEMEKAAPSTKTLGKKTTAQNIMEHLSEDEIVQMVREGKL